MKVTVSKVEIQADVTAIKVTLSNGMELDMLTDIETFSSADGTNT